MEAIIQSMGPGVFMPLLMAPIMILVGGLLYFFPPKRINSFYGYRTSNSMKNQENWDYAQRKSAKESIWSGVYLFGLSGICYAFEPDETTGIIIGLMGLFVVLGVLFYRVEKGIKSQIGH